MCGMMPGSGPLGNDFGLGNISLTKWRSTLGSANFGMQMTLNRNFEMIVNTDFINAVEVIPWNKLDKMKESNSFVGLQIKMTAPPVGVDELGEVLTKAMIALEF